MPSLGVLGTMVWDRILPPGGEIGAAAGAEGDAAVVEAWGGISYSLAAFEDSLPPDWSIVPIVKVGADLEARAWSFLDSLPRVDGGVGVRAVNVVNNRVELRYHGEADRDERMRGGVPPWSDAELRPPLAEVDALYVNFISGMECALDTARIMREACGGFVYADLHSLLLDVEPDGRRTPRRLDHARDWLRCFHHVQMNEAELHRLGLAGDRDPGAAPIERLAREVDGNPLQNAFVTIGARGATYVDAGRAPVTVPVAGGPRTGDPTGCGDVWGATCFGRLLAGDAVGDAVRAANDAASRKLSFEGTRGLDQWLAREGSIS